MLIALLLWTLAVAGVWWFADVVLAFLTPGAAWLHRDSSFHHYPTGEKQGTVNFQSPVLKG